MASLKQQLGCWLHERWRTELVLRFPRLAQRLGMSWIDLCNRHEQIEPDPRTGGRICQWADSSPLTVSRIFPRTSGRLLSRCLAEWPIQLADLASLEASTRPEISFVIAAHGTERIPQLQACLAALAAQSGCSIEIIVVEESWRCEFREILPPRVRHFHLRPAKPNDPFNKSRCLNIGVSEARSDSVVILDGDMLLPLGFASSVCSVLRDDVAALRPVRFLFYCDRESSMGLQDDRRLDPLSLTSSVVQNTPNPIVVRRDAYQSIGGHDEAFRGWGGEDNEFISRLRTLRFSEGGYLPAIHLWHPPAATRSQSRNAKYFHDRMATPAAERIRRLTSTEHPPECPASA